MGEKSLMSKGGNSNINLNDNVQRATTLVFKVKKISQKIISGEIEIHVIRIDDL